MDRREFLKQGSSLAAVLATGFLPEGLLASLAPESRETGSSQGGWNLKAWAEEQMEMFGAMHPWPEELKYLPRLAHLRGCALPPDGVKILQTTGGTDCYVPRRAFKRALAMDSQPHYVCLSIGAKATVDLVITLSDRADLSARSANRRVYILSGVKGDVDVLIPVDEIESADVFYQVMLHGMKGQKPVSPVCRFGHPKYKNKMMAYVIGDPHAFDDRFVDAEPVPGSKKSPVVSGLEGEYFHYFFEKLLKDPNYFKGMKIENLKSGRLRNTFHLAEAIAYIFNKGEQPDMIFMPGDIVGMNHCASQGLPPGDLDGNARKLWERERKVLSLVTPLCSVYDAIGNHDGEDGWKETRPFAVKWRKRLWIQPGAAEGSSRDQNYYKVFWNDGRFEFVVLDARGYLKKFPASPEEHTLGAIQKSWFVDEMNKSEADLKIVLLHHVIGGYPTNLYGTGKGAHGLGPVFTSEDCRRHGLDPEKIEQTEITEVGLRKGVRAFIKGHDHVEFIRKIGSDGQGKPVYGICAGTTNEASREPTVWAKNPHWRMDYGHPQERKAYFSPVLGKLEMEGSRMVYEAVCASTDAERVSNLYPWAKLGQVLRRVVMEF